MNVYVIAIVTFIILFIIGFVWFFASVAGKIDKGV